MSEAELRRRCAVCSETEYSRCLGCRVHQLLNRACENCGGLGAVHVLVRWGRASLNVCGRCLKLLT